MASPTLRSHRRVGMVGPVKINLLLMCVKKMLMGGCERIEEQDNAQVKAGQRGS